MAPLITLTDVSRTVAGRRILAPVTASIDQGTATVVTGANGSGKTTLLRLLLRRDQPTTGSIDVDRRLHPRDVAAVMQPPPFYENLTVAEHLVFVQASWGVATSRASALAWLENLGAPHIADSFPGELSSGERQLVSLSFALLRPAALIVLDEPEQRLDTERRSLVGELLAQRRHGGQTLVMATHDPLFVQLAAGRRIDLPPAAA